MVKTPNPLRRITRSFEEQKYRDLAGRIEARLRSADGLTDIAAQVEVVVTQEGLRIELVEGGDGEMFFALGKSELKPAAARALAAIATELKEGRVTLERHAGRPSTRSSLRPETGSQPRTAACPDPLYFVLQST